ncbi:hypothetical protein [Chryseobacterium culicis]|uniref:hypothetical protein n=1 Tax=Chryseobacterium culicis TaxID=680127 RepID=UPI002898C38F|nr:hypothetical protein [Chryseobacterium culicis]
METILIYFILVLSLCLSLLQIFISLNYFKRFAVEYLSNLPSSWNPNYDRSALAFSICFGLFSLYLTKLIWRGETDNSWFLTTVYILMIVLFSFFSIYYLTFIQKDKKSSLIKKEDDAKIWRHTDMVTNPNIFEYFIETKKISTEASKDDFHLIFSDQNTKTKVIWTGKYNGRLTYTTLILFYKVVLKREHFTKENIRNEMEKKFLFEKRDPDTGATIVGELDHGSFDNAFDRINFDNLLEYQQKEFDKYSEFFK